MELGSQVCLPRQPLCDQCPLAKLCPTRAHGWQAQIPAPRKQPQMVDVHEAAVAIQRGKRILLWKRPAGERWAGLWDFPRFELAGDDADAHRQQLRENVQRALGLHIDTPAHFVTLKHGVTRFRITLDCFVAACLPGGRTKSTVEVRWLRSSEIEQYPLSTTGRKLSRLLAAGGSVVMP